MPTRKLCIIGCAAIAVALMSFAAPMAANAVVLQEDYFTEDTLGETNWSNTDGTPLTLDTVNDQLDWDFPIGEGRGSQWDLSPSSSGTEDGDTWTISWDMQLAAFTEDPWTILEFMGDAEKMLEIQFKDDGTDMEINPRGDILGEDGDVITGLSVDTWYHVDLVFNRSGSELVDYNGTQDLLDDKADLWVDGALGVWGFDLMADWPVGPGDLDTVEFYAKGGGDDVGEGIFDNTVVSSGANVVPEPATMSMLLMAIGGLALLLRRRR